MSTLVCISCDAHSKIEKLAIKNLEINQGDTTHVFFFGEGVRSLQYNATLWSSILRQTEIEVIVCSHSIQQFISNDQLSRVEALIENAANIHIGGLGQLVEWSINARTISNFSNNIAHTPRNYHYRNTQIYLIPVSYTHLTLPTTSRV